MDRYCSKKTIQNVDLDGCQQGPIERSVQQQCLRVTSQNNEAALGQLAKPWLDFQLCRDIAGLQLKECTSAALALCTDFGLLNDFDRVELYTDGSAKNGAAGFAVVFIAQSTSGAGRRTAFMGYLAGPVELHSESDLYLGATAEDSMQAEVSAVTWATLWTLAHKMTLPGVAVDFRFDNMLAGMTASGKWTDQSCALVRKSRQIMQYCEQLWGACGFRWTHTAAHQGHPWNELADVIAGAARRREQGIDSNLVILISPSPTSVAWTEQGVARVSEMAWPTGLPITALRSLLHLRS